MEHAGPTERAGVHLAWSAVPARVHAWAREVAGGPIDHVVECAGGFSPGATARLARGDGCEIFVKAVGAELNPESPGIHRREAAVAAALPESSLWPRLLDTFDDGSWVALAFEAIDGANPALPWAEPVLDAAMAGLESLHGALTPSPVSVVPPASIRLRAVLNGWHMLVEDPDAATRLDPWSRRHLDRLVDVETGWPAACVGDTLVHCDIRSDNIVMRGDGTAAFVDWPHAAVGAGFVDLVFWAPSLVLEGGPDPESLLARYRGATGVDPEAVTTMVAALAGFFISRSLQPDPPGLPTLRRFQAAQGEVARAWLQRRTGW